MTLLTSLLTNATALMIADLIAKVALVVGIAGAVTHVLKLRRASAATQHLVWAASVVALIALPVLTVTAPSWKVEIAPATVAAPTPAEVVTVINSPESVRLEIGRAHV